MKTFAHIRLRRTTCALALGSMMLAVAPALGIANDAASDSTRLQVVAFQAAPGDSDHALILKTRACLAAIRERRFDPGKPACDAAIGAARAAPYGAIRGQAARGAIAEADELAAAYSNRAVLEHLRGNDAAAIADLRTALKLAPDAAFARLNAEVVERRFAERMARR